MHDKLTQAATVKPRYNVSLSLTYSVGLYWVLGICGDSRTFPPGAFPPPGHPPPGHFPLGHFPLGLFPPGHFPLGHPPRPFYVILVSVCESNLQRLQSNTAIQSLNVIQCFIQCSMFNGREPGTGVRWTSECTLGQELDFWWCGRDENFKSMRVGCGKSQLRH